MSVGIVVFDGVEELDFVGPWEVFTMAAAAGAPLTVFTMGWPDRTIACAKGLTVRADHTLADAPHADIVLVPGGRGTRQLVAGEPFLDVLGARLAAARWQCSVCTGAALLGATVLLAGRRATTNRRARDFVTAFAPDAQWDMSTRYVRDGSVVTAAGVSAGIDMALWLTGALFSADLARTTQSLMEYFPEPPYGPMT